MTHIPTWQAAIGWLVMLAFLVLLWGLIAKVVDLRRDLFRQQEHERFLHEAKKELEERLAYARTELHRAERYMTVLEDTYRYVCKEYGVREELRKQFLVAAASARGYHELSGLQGEQVDSPPAVRVRSDHHGRSEEGRPDELREVEDGLPGDHH